MDTVLGLLGMILWIIAVIALAAGVTYAVIRVSPSGRPKSTPEEAAGPPS